MTPAISRMIDELETLGKTRDDAYQIPRVEGELLMQIALAIGAKNIAEIGTSYGFSGLFWGAALQQTGGRLHTIDIEPKKFESSKATFAKAGLSDVVTNHLGDAAAILPTLPGPFDLAFIDADKPACINYLEMIWPKLRTGGSVITDNVTSHPHQLGDFVQYVRSRKGVHSTTVAVGNGIEWTIKL